MKKFIIMSIAMLMLVLGFGGTLPNAAARTLKDVVLTSVTVPTSQRITVQPFTQRQQITTWGLDLKNPAQIRQFADRPAYVQRVMGDRRLNLMRVPLRADVRAVTSTGHVNEAYYADVIKAIRNVRAVNPAVRIMASRKTISDCATYHNTLCLDFAPSLKNLDGSVSTTKYGKLIAEYLLFMRRQGLTASFLSIENEPQNNEGNMSPTRFAMTIGTVRNNYPFTMPVIMGNDGVIGDVPWLRNAPSYVTVASSHSNSRFYPNQISGIKNFASVAKNRGARLWNTEMHWNDNAPRARYSNAATTLLTFFDHTDAGYSGFSWWGWNQDGVKGQMWKNYIRTTLNARPITVTDRDGGGAVRSSLVTRAYRIGNVMYLWVLNDTANTVWNQRIFGTTSWRPTMDVYRQSGTDLVHSRQDAVRMDNKPTFDFRPHTISLVALRVS